MLWPRMGIAISEVKGIIIVTEVVLVSIAIPIFDTIVRMYALTYWSMCVAVTLEKDTFARPITVYVVIPLTTKHSFQFGIRQFQFADRICRQLSTFFVTKTLTIKLVFPCTHNITIHQYFPFSSQNTSTLPRC